MATKKAKAKKSRRVAAPGDDATYRVAKLYKSPKKISIADLPAQFTRADLEFIRVEHSGASCEARCSSTIPTLTATPRQSKQMVTPAHSVYSGTVGALAI